MAKKKKKSNKIIRYRRPLNINVGMIIFAIIFLYLVFSVVSYFRRERVQYYEVVDGGIVNDRIYTGLVLREETVYTVGQAGYVNYYLREGKRAGVGSRIYTLDETGELEALLAESTKEGEVLSQESLLELRTALTQTILSLDDVNFSQIYDARYTLEAAVIEYSSFSALEEIDRLARESGAVFEQARSEVSGVVSYSFDGYEGMTPSDVQGVSFDRSTYVKTTNKSGKMLDVGAPAYKIVTSEDWSIVFQLSDEDKELYAEASSLNIAFRNENLSVSCPFSIITGQDGGSYGLLTFTRYMGKFLSDRFVEFEVEVEQEQGLKIPVTAVTSKDFLLVPQDYLVQDEESSDSGFLKEVYDENGSHSVFIPAEVFYADEDYYYIEDSGEKGFSSGDYVVLTGGGSRYQLGRTASLKGVYNINKGYTVFKQIDIIDSNSEYYTVRKGTKYGLSVYDHIVLDASMVEEGQLLYQ